MMLRKKRKNRTPTGDLRFLLRNLRLVKKLYRHFFSVYLCHTGNCCCDFMQIARVDYSVHCTGVPHHPFYTSLNCTSILRSHPGNFHSQIICNTYLLQCYNWSLLLPHTQVMSKICLHQQFSTALTAL